MSGRGRRRLSWCIFGFFIGLLLQLATAHAFEDVAISDSQLAEAAVKARSRVARLHTAGATEFERGFWSLLGRNDLEAAPIVLLVLVAAESRGDFRGWT